MVRVDELSFCCPTVNESRWDIILFCSSYLSVAAYVCRSAEGERLSTSMASRIDSSAGPDDNSTLRMRVPRRPEERLNGVLTQCNHRVRLNKQSVR